LDGFAVPAPAQVTQTVGFQVSSFSQYFFSKRLSSSRRFYLAVFSGVSTEKVGQVLETLNGSHPSPSTVSRVFHTLEEEYEHWKKRPLQSHYLYVIADGTYFSVIYDGQGTKMPILAAIGIDAEGKREVLGFSTGDRENQQAWEALFDNLKERGLEQVDLWITDGGKAMINAIESKFLNAKRQRCVWHKMENILGYIPRERHEQVKPELRAIQQSVHLTLGILRKSQAVSYALSFFWLDGFAVPAPAQVTQTVGRPTKRAPDAGDSAHISSSFLRLIIFLAGRLRRPRPSAGNANRWAPNKACT
jgi:hypothetical protein